MSSWANAHAYSTCEGSYAFRKVSHVSSSTYTPSSFRPASLLLGGSILSTADQRKIFSFMWEHRYFRKTINIAAMASPPWLVHLSYDFPKLHLMWLWCIPRNYLQFHPCMCFMVRLSESLVRKKGSLNWFRFHILTWQQGVEILCSRAPVIPRFWKIQKKNI